jgi:hypothetical protein
MAICKTSNEIESVSGQFGGIYFKKDNAGQHIQAMPRSVRKASMQSPITYSPLLGGSRSAYILSWTKKAKQWLMIASILWYFSEVWQSFADANEWKNKRGKITKPTAYNWWMHFNVTRDVEGLPPYTYPPRSSLTLPVYTIVGPWFTAHLEGTVNLYKKDLLIHELPWYTKDTNKYTKDSYSNWSDGASSYISPGPSLLNEWQWWEKAGTDRVGIYDPNPEHPELGTVIVNF